MIADAESILKICGLGSYLQIGCANSQLTFEMLKRSVDIYGLDKSPEVIAQYHTKAPGRFIQGSLTNYPFSQTLFDTIIIGFELINYRPEEVNQILMSLRNMTRRHLVLYFPQDNLNVLPNNVFSNRLFWEKICIQSGYRKHPRSMLVTEYPELENEKMGTFLFLEKVPEQSNQHFPLAWLLENRDLHMDMLREAGRRSDGHVSRYVYAAKRIRPGDVVLDAACGMGYGTAVLATCSPGAKFIGVDIDPESVKYANLSYGDNDNIKFHASDVTQLSFLADHSVDTVISFETIEHVPDYDAFLKEVTRVLKPDGLFIGSVPNLWCDETGKDPNPYHFHVFDWNKLHQSISKYFIVDERVAQTAGGGYKLPTARRVLQKIPLHLNATVETEWWLISGYVNPLAHAALPYSNRYLQNSEQPIPTHVDFGKYYDNPWVYREIIQLGERIADKQVLIDLCTKVALNSRVGSADQGAALCVIGYQILESGNVTLADVSSLTNLINEFDNAYDKQNPHSHRWAISLHYLGGRLLLALGQHEEALHAFESCVNMDPLEFSPLLATKTISSYMYIGLLSATRREYIHARDAFVQAMKESHRIMQNNWEGIIGSFDKPLGFGLQEAAEVLDIASQCSQALIALNKIDIAPGYFWDKINLKRFGLVEWNKSLERENRELRNKLNQKVNTAAFASAS